MRKSTAEQWKDVVGVPTYQISSFGRARRLLKTGKWKAVEPKLVENVLSYQFSSVHRAGGKLVLETFGIDRPTAEHIVLYKNGDIRDLRLSNLDWQERPWAYHPPKEVENIDPKKTYQKDLSAAEWAMIVMTRAEEKRKSGLTLLQHYEVLISTLSSGKLAKIYGVNRQAICQIRQRRTIRPNFKNS